MLNFIKKPLEENNWVSLYHNKIYMDFFLINEHRLYVRFFTSAPRHSL